MLPAPSRLALHALRTLTRSNLTTANAITTSRAPALFSFAISKTSPRTTRTILFPWSASGSSSQTRSFTSTPIFNTTLNQVRTQGRKPKKARRTASPAVRGRSELKGVCLKVGITKPKKPNSGQRKTAKVRLSTGRVVSAYIPGEGHNVQQHSVVMVRGGRSQDCPGVGYHLVRGALDLGGVASRATSRSKYGTKKPKTA